MMTRLVLVGMVAALGISVPTTPDIQGWMNAVHSWTAHQLANWDTSAHQQANAITLPPPVDFVPAWHPIVVEAEVSGPAYDLNRAAEGLDIVLAPEMGRRTPSVEATERTTPGTVLGEFPVAPAVETLEMRVMSDLLLAAERANSEVRPAEGEVIGPRAKSIVSPAECVFTPGKPATPATSGPTSPIVESGPTAVAIASKTDLIEPVADTPPELDGEASWFVQAIERTQPAAIVSTASEPPFDPIDPGSSVDEGLAFELNRAADVVAITRDPGDHPETSSHATLNRADTPVQPTAPMEERSPSPGPSPDVAHAIRLTGEAALAWMKIVTGPAVVQVSVR